MRAFKEASTIAIAAAAVGMGDLVRNGYASAVDQIDAMTRASLNFNATLKQTADLQNTISNISDTTAQSFSTTADQMSTLAQLSFTVAQAKTLGPVITRAADLIQFLSGKKTDPIEATKDIGQLAHLYGVYDVKSVEEVARLTIGLSKTQPEALSKVVTQTKYFGPIFSALGVSLGQAFATTAGMGIMGFLQSKGGTSAAGALLGGISANTLTSHLSKAKLLADQQSHLGILDARGQPAFYKNGVFDIAGMFKHLADDEARYKANPATLGGLPGFVKDLAAAFGKSATPFILASLRPETIKQVTVAQSNMRAENVNADYAKLQTDPAYVQQLVGTNLQNIMATAFKPLVMWVTPHLLDLASALTAVDKILRKDTWKAWAVSLGAISAAVGLAVGAAWRFIKPIWGIAGAATAAAKATTAAAASMALAAEEIRLASLGLPGAVVPGAPVVAGGARAAVPTTVAEVEKNGWRFGTVMKSIGAHLLEIVSFGAIAGAGNWTWLARVGAWFAELGAAALAVVTSPVTAFLIGIAGAFGILYAAVTKPVDFGRMVAQIQDFFQYKVGSAITGGWATIVSNIGAYLKGAGTASVTSAFAFMVGDIVAMVTNQAATVGNVLRDLGNFDPKKAMADLQAGNNRQAVLRADYDKRIHAEQAKNDKINTARRNAYSQERSKAAYDANFAQPKPAPLQSGDRTSTPVSITNTITINGAKDPKQIAREIGNLSEEQAARVGRANGGLSSSPYNPQLPRR